MMVTLLLPLDWKASRNRSNSGKDKWEIRDTLGLELLVMDSRYGLYTNARQCHPGESRLIYGTPCPLGYTACAEMTAIVSQSEDDHNSDI